MLRRRNINLKIVKELDAFPKIPEDYKTQSAVGGTFSLVSFCIIIYFIYAETMYFLDGRLKFQFQPVSSFSPLIQLNVDLTVAMPCAYIGADVIDNSNENLIGFDSLQKKDTWWDLTPDQRAHFEALKHMNSYLTEEYHAIHELLWKSNQLAFSDDMPKRTYIPTYPPNACRISGTINIKAIAGNFHVTPGKPLTLPRGHVHISEITSYREYNFTHRINRFSFGKPSPGIIHPLEGDEKVTTDNMMLYQYFIEIVPTFVDMSKYKLQTFQYSVKDYQRSINYDKGSRGIPGIFFKYDISALRIRVYEEFNSVSQFIFKLCATIGCIFATNGVINRIVQNFWHIFCCKFWQSNANTNYENITVKKQRTKDINPVNLINVLPPPNIEEVDILRSQ